MLVGIDGSSDANDALAGAMDFLAGRVRRLTLASVLDYDTAGRAGESTERTRAEQALQSALAVLAGRSTPKPETTLLAGRPAEALLQHAREHDDDLLVVGPHGYGESDWLLGNVAAELTQQTAIPVMVLSGFTTNLVERSITGNDAG